MYKNILAPLDGSSEAESAIVRAKEFATVYGSTIHLVHVIEHLKTGVLTAGATRYPSEMNIEVERMYVEGQISQEEVYLKDLAMPLQSEGINVETSIDSGNVPEYIVGYAQRNDINVIVMTKHGHGGIRQLILGSTTDRASSSLSRLYRFFGHSRLYTLVRSP